MPKLVLKIFLFLELKTDSDHHVWRKKKQVSRSQRNFLGE
jgi:hypothetical protein